MIKVYEKLYCELGPKNWWPADTPYEVIIGAVLTQQTRWKNVEKAILNLKVRGLIEAEPLSRVDTGELEELIRCTGFFRQKARRLKNVSLFFHENPDVFKKSTQELRDILLSLNGIGEETADSIVLYAAEKPKFVIDAYTKRMCKCMGIEGNYEELQSIFERSLPMDVPLYKEFHALIVDYGKLFCGKKRCHECILVENGKM
ncbi:MAG: endonuclease [Candidatus Methanoperedens sp.]|nr:endonuclease [Candidatus Methanoperedens sp.]